MQAFPMDTGCCSSPTAIDTRGSSDAVKCTEPGRTTGQKVPSTVAIGNEAS